MCALRKAYMNQKQVVRNTFYLFWEMEWWVNISFYHAQMSVIVINGTQPFNQPYLSITVKFFEMQCAFLFYGCLQTDCFEHCKFCLWLKSKYTKRAKIIGAFNNCSEKTALQLFLTNPIMILKNHCFEYKALFFIPYFQKEKNITGHIWFSGQIFRLSDKAFKD